MSGAQSPHQVLRDAKEVLHELGTLIARPSDGKLTNRAREIEQLVNTLRVVPKWRQLYAARFERDLHAAIDARDQPRMARVLRSFFETALADMAADRLDQHAAQLEREINARASIPFDRFCVRWHETRGNPTERARHIADTEGGDYHAHRTRYYRNRRKVDARG